MIGELGHLCQFLNGGTPSKDKPHYFEGNIPWITSADIAGPIADTARSFITDEAIQNSSTNKVPKGTVLLVTRTGVGKVAIAGIDLCFSQDITAIKPEPSRLETGYLVHFLRTKRDHFERLARGATIKGVTRDVVTDLEIPLPPLPEQRRIAAILDQADALRAKRREALAELDQLTQSIFIEMFGDPERNPKGWNVRDLAEICEVKGGKRLPKGEEYSLSPTPYRYIRVTDLRDGRVNENDLVYLTPEVQARISRYTVSEGDVIISIAGSIGLIAPVTKLLDGVNLTENAAKLVPRDRAAVDAQYLAALLQTDYIQRQIASHVGQVTIGKLALFRIEKLRVPFAPIELQKEFALRLKLFSNLRVKLMASMAGIDSLFSSLQHRAFRGEL